MRIELLIVFFFTLLCSPKVKACTVVSLVDGDIVLVGNNEDWYIPYPQYHIIPGDGENTYDRILFSYHDNWGQGGMNEKGLFFDWVLKPDEATRWKQDPLKKDLNGNLSEEILARCSSVEEALQYFEEYNEPIFKVSYIVLVDTSGRTAFVSWEDDAVNIEECKGVCVGGYGGDKVVAKHKELEGDISKSQMIELLDAGHQEGENPTLYSNIYDLRGGRVNLYYYHNYEEEVVLDLHEEVLKGRHSVNLKDIFTTQIPASDFGRLRRNYLVKEVATIPLKGWLVVVALFSMIIVMPFYCYRMIKSF